MASPRVSAREWADRYVEQVMRYGQHWEHAQRALDEDPGWPFAMVLAADFAFARPDPDAAHKLLDSAVATRERASPQEQIYIDAFAAMARGEAREAFYSFRKISENDPVDLFALKRAQLMAFASGDLPSMLEVALSPAVVQACSDKPFYNGMVSFALEQNGRLDEAEAAGRKGVAIEPKDAWAHHGLAHALWGQRRFREGITWMEQHTDVWADCMSFMYTHNYFHLALFQLAVGDLPAVEHTFKRHIWGGPEQRAPSDDKYPVAFVAQDKAYAEDQMAALGILWKYELHGGRGLADQWEQVLRHVHVESAHSHGPLLGLHVLKALLRVGRVEEARALAGKLVEGKPGARDVLGPYTNFLLRAQEDGPAGGAAAWAEGALRFEQFHPVSGSLEQREVLHEEAVSVLLSADKHADATAYHAECSLRVPLDSLKSGTHA